MDMPVLFKDIEVEGRNFRLNKMNARTGSFMLFKLIKIITPIFKDLKLDNIEDIKDISLDDLNLTEVMSSIFDLPEKEFRYIQDNCLMVITEKLPAGDAPVLNKNGTFGVMNIEHDIALLMNLTVQSLFFNVSGFFEGSPLSSITKKLNISQLDLKI